MDAQKFVTWLQGFVELTNAQSITDSQWKMIKEHLSLVFKKLTPEIYVNTEVDTSGMRQKTMQEYIDEMRKKGTWPDDRYYIPTQPFPQIWAQEVKLDPFNTPIC